MKLVKTKSFLFVFVMVIVGVMLCSCGADSDKKNINLDAFQNSQGSDYVALVWKSVYDAEKYKVYVFDESSGEYDFYKETSECFLSVGELLPATQYKIKVEAVGGKKALCEIKAVTQPANVNTPWVIQRSLDSVIIKWDEIENADGYDVFVYDEEKKKYSYYVSTGVNMAQISGLPSGSASKIAVSSYKLMDEYKAVGEPTSVEVHTFCTAPSEVSVQDRTGDGYTIKWSESENADGYDLSVYNPDIKGYCVYKNDITETQLIVDGLKNGDSKKYRITPFVTVNGEKIISSDSSYVDAVTRIKAVEVSTESFPGGIQAKWKKNKDADGYNVYYSAQKDGEYTFAGKTDGDKTSFGIGDLEEREYFVKVVPFKKYNGVPFEGEETIATGSAFRNDHNEILTSYKPSKKITVTNSDFEISDSRRNAIMNLINSYSGSHKTSFAMVDIRSGAMIGYNADWYAPTASTIKAPYICYVLSQEIDTGNASLDDLLTYEKRFYDGDGSGEIRFMEYGTKLTVKEVIEYILYYSDNCGYLMLLDHFGAENYNKWLESLGCKTFIDGKALKWGFVSARDSAKIWTKIYKYMYTGKYGDFFKEELLTTGYSPIRKNLGHLYKVANKFGGADTGWHDTGIVFKDDNPYIMILLTDDCYLHPNYSYQNSMIKQLDALHDELVEFNAKNNQ